MHIYARGMSPHMSMWLKGFAFHLPEGECPPVPEHKSSRKLLPNLTQHLFSQLIVFVCSLVSFQVSLPRLQVLKIQLTVSHKLSDFTESYPWFWECPCPLFALFYFFFCKSQFSMRQETRSVKMVQLLYLFLLFFFIYVLLLLLNDVAVAINSLA